MQPLEQVRGDWTVEELDDLGFEDWRRCQIIDGSLFVSPAPNIEHEFVVSYLRGILDSQLTGQVTVLGSAGIDLGRSYLIPDAVVVPRAVRARRQARLAPTDVLLVVEVVSPGSVTTDRITKPAQYAAAGIPAYWRVETDPIGLSAYVLAAGASTYTEVGTWGRGETARIAELFPVTVEIDTLAG